MTRSSPARRSQLLTSPERRFISSFLSDDRNNELSHRDALIAAQLEHERVREAAIRVYELHEIEREHRRIEDDKKKEEARLKAEALLAAEELRLRELRAKTVPRPPPEPEPKPAPQPTPEKKEITPAVNGSTPIQEPKKSEPSTTPPSEPKPPSTQTNGVFSNQNKSSPFAAAAQSKPAIASPFAPTTTTQPKASISPFGQPAASTAPAPAPAVKPATTPARPAAPVQDRYMQIHQELKKLRKELQAQAKVPGSPLKGKMGTFRREIRVSIGQLTGGKGANAQPISKITTTLKESLSGQIPSPPIDVSLFVREKREPAEQAEHNGPTMPSLFIYLINICAKAIINQFINECGANPKAADPIGVFTAHIFSQKEFHWRGQTLIDILMAKFRIVCPVLFGFRGNDKMERGRLAIGWKKDGPSWITEQSHNDRMTGLGAGYASLSLRDFSRSSKTNPYPPVNYWKALAGIVNSPIGEISNTQYVVLRSMIEGHEQRFLTFYGNAGLAALQLALVEFPKKAPESATAAGSLRALAEMFKADGGLILV